MHPFLLGHYWLSGEEVGQLTTTMLQCVMCVGEEYVGVTNLLRMCVGDK